MRSLPPREPGNSGDGLEAAKARVSPLCSDPPELPTRRMRASDCQPKTVTRRLCRNLRIQKSHRHAQGRTQRYGMVITGVLMCATALCGRGNGSALSFWHAWHSVPLMVSCAAHSLHSPHRSAQRECVPRSTRF